MTTFDVRGNLSERLDVRAQPNEMKMMAEESGGAVLEAGRAANCWPSGSTPTSPHPSRTLGADDGLGPLVGAVGGFCHLGRRVGAPPPVGIGVK